MIPDEVWDTMVSSVIDEFISGEVSYGRRQEPELRKIIKSEISVIVLEKIKATAREMLKEVSLEKRIEKLIAESKESVIEGLLTKIWNSDLGLTMTQLQQFKTCASCGSVHQSLYNECPVCKQTP